MASAAKNPRISPDRRVRSDRRQAVGRLPAQGERRRAGRRLQELARPRWQRVTEIAIAAFLGVAAAHTLGRLDRAEEAAPQPAAAAAPTVVHANERSHLSSVDRDRIERWRDEAEMLTPAAVFVDEHAHEVWLPRVAELETALDDPSTDGALRNEVRATLHALAAVGILARTR